jgi:hypothetical protein
MNKKIEEISKPKELVKKEDTDDTPNIFKQNPVTLTRK